jgi:hypothetical protein
MVAQRAEGVLNERPLPMDDGIPTMVVSESMTTLAEM